uniref:Uncharacterized protein n=1 Tax=Anguilla anguilla TaxID=7936 RepID=A0A0E9VAF3_ANGAN
MVPGSLGWAWAVLAAITTLAPSLAAFSAMALPMPRLAPVINRVHPASFPVLGNMSCGEMYQAKDCF